MTEVDGKAPMLQGELKAAGAKPDRKRPVHYWMRDGGRRVDVQELCLERGHLGAERAERATHTHTYLMHDMVPRGWA
jgi:hypothetical protein